jgi:hypothetical protein
MPRLIAGDKVIASDLFILTLRANSTIEGVKDLNNS